MFRSTPQKFKMCFYYREILFSMFFFSFLRYKQTHVVHHYIFVVLFSYAFIEFENEKDMHGKYQQPIMLQTKFTTKEDVMFVRIGSFYGENIAV